MPFMDWNITHACTYVPLQKSISCFNHRTVTLVADYIAIHRDGG